jgi:hypothetical protein
VSDVNDRLTFPQNRLLYRLKALKRVTRQIRYYSIRKQQYTNVQKPPGPGSPVLCGLDKGHFVAPTLLVILVLVLVILVLGL